VFAVLLAIASLLTQDRTLPAGQTAGFENLQVLTGVEPDQLQLIMQATAVSLGVECNHCHDTTAYESDALAAKRTARDMMRMVAELGGTTFELLETPSCWTCHRGATSPVVRPPVLDLPPPPAPPEAFSASTSPAGEVYDNVVVYADRPANELQELMEGFTRALGVGCDHCHVETDWASDDNILKPLTRLMVRMQGDLETGRFGGREVVSCWTCHRGDATPESSIPAALMPRVR
jgi:hypothetical protein